MWNIDGRNPFGCAFFRWREKGHVTENIQSACGWPRSGVHVGSVAAFRSTFAACASVRRSFCIHTRHGIGERGEEKGRVGSAIDERAKGHNIDLDRWTARESLVREGMRKQEIVGRVAERPTGSFFS